LIAKEGDHKFLSVFAALMMLAFLVDQIQQACCKLFQAALGKFHAKIFTYEKQRVAILIQFRCTVFCN
jgi:hypothetical protein